MTRMAFLGLAWTLISGGTIATHCWGQMDEKKVKVDSELKWTTFDEAKYDKQKFTGPTIVAIMRDLCPGCKAKRDAVWSNKKVIEAVSQRNPILFDGNAQTDDGLDELIKRKFKVKDLPVVIIRGPSMSATPVIVPGIPSPETLLKALEKHLPLKMPESPKR